MYKRAWAVFSEFYHRFHNEPFRLPLPPASITLFIAYLCAKGLAPATINSYLSAIAYVHKVKGLFDPTKSFLIEKLLVAVGRRTQADTRLPLSRPLLYSLIAALNHTSPSGYQRTLYTSMFLLAFYGFFRIGELTCKLPRQSANTLQLQNVTFLVHDNQICSIKIVITKFKHNTNNRPFTIIIDRESSEPHCPVQCLLDYLKVRGCQQGQLFSYPNGEPVTVTKFNTQLRSALNFCGLDSSRYKGHSFRIGAACYAAEKGMSDAQIRILGRWSSDAFKVYIRPPSLNAN